MPFVADKPTLFNSGGLDSPPRHLAIPTPSDTDDLATSCRAISFKVAGDIKVTTLGGETIVIPSGQFVVGQWHAMELTRIWENGTTATGIMVGW